MLRTATEADVSNIVSFLNDQHDCLEPITLDDVSCLVNRSAFTVLELDDSETILGFVALSHLSKDLYHIVSLSFESVYSERAPLPSSFLYIIKSSTSSLNHLLSFAFKSIPYLKYILSPLSFPSSISLAENLHVASRTDVLFPNSTIELRNVFLEEFDDILEIFPQDFLFQQTTSDDLIKLIESSEQSSTSLCRILTFNNDPVCIFSASLISPPLSFLDNDEIKEIKWREEQGEETRFAILDLFCMVNGLEFFSEGCLVINDIFSQLNVDVLIVSDDSNTNNSGFRLFPNHPLTFGLSSWANGKLQVVDSASLLSNLDTKMIDDVMIMTVDSGIELNFELINSDLINDFTRCFRLYNQIPDTTNCSGVLLKSHSCPRVCHHLLPQLFHNCMTLFDVDFVLSSTNSFSKSEMIVLQHSMKICEPSMLSRLRFESLVSSDHLSSSLFIYESKMIGQGLSKYPLHLVILGNNESTMSILIELISSGSYFSEITVIDENNSLETLSLDDKVSYYPINGEFHLNQISRICLDQVTWIKGTTVHIDRALKLVEVDVPDQGLANISYDCLIITPIYDPCPEPENQSFLIDSAPRLYWTLDVISGEMIQPETSILIVNQMFSSPFAFSAAISELLTLKFTKITVLTASSQKYQICDPIFDSLKHIFTHFATLGVEFIYYNDVLLNDHYCQYIDSQGLKQSIDFDLCLNFVEKQQSLSFLSLLTDSDIVVRNQSILIDHFLRTNDPSIFCVGKFTSLSTVSKLEHAFDPNFQSFSHQLSSKYLVQILTHIFDPSVVPLDVCTNNCCLILPKSVDSLKNKLTELMKLVNNPTKSFYFHLFDNSEPWLCCYSVAGNVGSGFNFSQTKCLVQDSPNCYCRLFFNTNDELICSFICFKQGQNVTIIDLFDQSKLIGLHSSYMNNIVKRFNGSSQSNLIDFLSQPWSLALYDDYFYVIRQSFLIENENSEANIDDFAENSIIKLIQYSPVLRQSYSI
ncbi:hypothetical protein RCL1_002509 [Eukaryota sp. TZLM3-RCL]